jgi:GDP-L-fucose synthase
LARLIGEVVGFEGEILWDRSKPDGTPRKLMDSERLRGMGWRPEVGVRDGVGRTYEWFRALSEGLALEG